MKQNTSYKLRIVCLILGHNNKKYLIQDNPKMWEFPYNSLTIEECQRCGKQKGDSVE